MKAESRLRPRRQDHQCKEAKHDRWDAGQELDRGLHELADHPRCVECDEHRAADAKRDTHQHREQRYLERPHEERNDVELGRLADWLPNEDRLVVAFPLLREEEISKLDLFGELHLPEHRHRLACDEDEDERDRRNCCKREHRDGAFRNAVPQRRLKRACQSRPSAVRTHGDPPLAFRRGGVVFACVEHLLGHSAAAVASLGSG